MNIINGCICHREGSSLYCMFDDMIKIMSKLTPDGYVISNWTIYDNALVDIHLGAKYDCLIVLDTVEEIEMREVETTRWEYVRQGVLSWLN